MTERENGVIDAPLVVGYDGSATAGRALATALDLAARMRAPLVIVRAIGDADREDLARDARPFLAVHPEVRVTLDERVGRPVDTLREVSAGARMLVLGSRGLGGLTGLLLGSVSNGCLHSAECPVLVVPGEGQRASTPSEAHVEQMTPMPWDTVLPRLVPGSIVVGHDGSRRADRALGAAITLADRLRAHVDVIRTWTIDTAPRGSLWDEGYVPSLHEISEVVRGELEGDVARLTGSRAADPAVTCHALYGSAGDLLTLCAKDALMLVVGSRGRGGFAGLVLGSVSTQCVHRAACPVLVVGA